jgi:hypothetical protein
MKSETLGMAVVFALGVIGPALQPSPASAATIALTPADDRRGIFMFGLDTESADVHVHGYAGDGTIQGSDLSFTNYLSTFHPGPLAIDISIAPLFLQGLLAAGEDFAGFDVRNVTVQGGVFVVWTVDGPAATDPTLAIEYVDDTAIPEPATLLLLGTAMTACGISLRRRRA